jgi:hypothetical protein
MGCGRFLGWGFEFFLESEIAWNNDDFWVGLIYENEIEDLTVAAKREIGAIGLGLPPDFGGKSATGLLN